MYIYNVTYIFRLFIARRIPGTIMARILVQELGKILRGRNDVIIWICTPEEALHSVRPQELCNPRRWRESCWKKGFDMLFRPRGSKYPKEDSGKAFKNLAYHLIPTRPSRPWYVYLREEKTWVLISDKNQRRQMYTMAADGRATIQISWDDANSEDPSTHSSQELRLPVSPTVTFGAPPLSQAPFYFTQLLDTLSLPPTPEKFLEGIHSPESLSTSNPLSPRTVKNEPLFQLHASF